MASITAQWKDLKRRGMQTVLQHMGMADKTTDDLHSQAYHNFDTLGNFVTHFKQSVIGATASLEKMTKLQSSVASNIQAYLHSELSGDMEPPTGELVELFSAQDDEASTHAVMLQELSERFYFACNDIANSVFQNMMSSLDESLLKPILRDEEQNALTKELLEERKKLNLDYDSYRRAAQSSASPSDQERNDMKLRAAKEKYEACSKRVNDHLALRSYKRSKIIVHTVLTLIQEYNKFFSTCGTLFQEVTGVLNPLAENYIMNERQFLELYKQDARPPKHHGASIPAAKNGSPPPSPKQAKAPKPQPAVPPKPQPTRQPSPPRRQPSPPRQASPPPTAAKEGLNGNSASSAPPKPKPQPSPLVADLIDDPFATTPTTATAPPQATSPKSGNIFDDWEGVNATTNNSTNNSASFVDTTFPDIPATTSPIPPTKHSSPSPSPQPSMFDDFDFGKPATTPLKPQQSTFPQQPNYKSAPGNNFNMPQQPGFKPQANSFPQQPKPNYGTGFNAPPFGGMPQHKPAAGMPGGFPQQPSGMPGGFPQQPGGMPGGFGQPGGFPPGYGAGGHGGPPPGGFPAGGYGPSGGHGYRPPGAGPAPGFNAGATFSSFLPQQEADGLDAALVTKIRQWSEKGGKKNTLRVLLSTLHEVLWQDSGWELRGPGELVSPANTKRAYRQATLIVHPDKVSSCTEEQKLIAKRIFEILSESYEVFKKEP